MAKGSTLYVDLPRWKVREVQGFEILKNNILKNILKLNKLSKNILKFSLKSFKIVYIKYR